MRQLSSLVLAIALSMTAVLSGSAHADDYARFRALFQPLPEQPPIPADNPQTPEKIELGRMLYFEPRLSKSGVISCATCHNPAMGYADRLPVAVGHNGLKGPRNSPTVLNSAFLGAQFWDGRAADLEEQALGPIQADVEMAMPLEDAVAALKGIEEYRNRFAAIWKKQKDPITPENIGKAIAAFERTLNTPDSPFDHYLKGDDKALTAQQKRGMAAFVETGCVACHRGPALTDSNFHRFELPGSDDQGRYDVTGLEADRKKFRTQTLRNVTLTYPYFHNGSVATLGEAISLMAKNMLGKDLDEKTISDIEAFLGSLTGTMPEVAIPTLP